MNKLKNLLAAVGLFAVLIGASLSSLGQSGGGGSTVTTVTSSGAAADANMVTTTNSNTFGVGLTQTVNGSLTASNLTVLTLGTFNSFAKSNYFTGPTTFLTNAPTAGYDFVVDKRWHPSGYLYMGLFGNANGAYIDWGQITSSKYVEMSYDGNAIMNQAVQSGILTYDVSFGSVNTHGEIKAAGSARRIYVAQPGVIIGPVGSFITNIVSATIVADPPSLGTLASFTTNWACTGARVGNCPISVGTDYRTNGIRYEGYCLTNGTIWCDIYNTTGGTIDAPSQTLRGIQTVIE
jgi:hypothetical protein